MKKEKQYEDMTKIEKISYLRDSYKTLGDKIFSGEWGGGEWWDFKIIHADKIDGHRSRGSQEAYETVLKILSE